MRLVKAVVVRRDTADGVPFLRDEVAIGFLYWADLETIERTLWLDTRTGKMTERESAMVYGSATGQGNPVGYMPLELFQLEES